MHAETCGDALAIEPGGDLCSCVHFVYPQYKLGNIKATPLAQMVDSPRQRQFDLNKRAMAQLNRHRRPASEVMDLVAKKQLPVYKPLK